MANHAAAAGLRSSSPLRHAPVGQRHMKKLIGSIMRYQFLIHVLWIQLASVLLFAVTDAIAVEIAKRPLKFTDTSGKEIETYCVAPLYVKSHGIGWGVESTGRKSDPERYILWPAIIKKGEGLDKIRTTSDKGFLILFYPIRYGESLGPTAYLILKKGFAPVYWNSYIDVTKVRTVPMAKGNSESVLKTLISTNPAQKDLREIFHLKEDVSVVNSYTDADRALLYNCYYKNSD